MPSTLPTGYVLPTPAPARLIGILNLLFGGLLLVAGVGMLALTLLHAIVTKIEPTKRGFQFSAGISANSAKGKDADGGRSSKSEPKPRETVQTPNAKPMSAGEQWRYVFTLADMLSGIALNAGLIASGFGLFRLQSWGRKLGIWVAVAKIVRLAMIMGITLLLLVPMDLREGRRDWETASRAESKGPRETSAERAEALEEIRIFATVQAIFTVGFCLAGMLYPVIVLVVLKRRGVRGACLAASRGSMTSGAVRSSAAGGQ